MATTQEVPAYQEDQRDAGLVAQTEKLGLHEQELEHDHANGLSNGLAIDNDHGIVRDVNGLPLTEHEDAVDSNKPTDLGHPYSENELREEYEHENGTIGETASIRTSNTRPTMKEPSRSYARSIPIVTTYEPELEDTNVNKRQSVAGSVRSVSRAPSVMAAGVIPAPVQAAPSVRAPSVKAPSVKRAASTKAESYREPVSPVIAQKAPSVRSPSRAGSVKANSIRRQSQQPNGDLQPGSVISPERQREMQNRVSLVDNGARRNDDYNQQQQRSVSPRPTSPFGHRPQPNLMSVIEDGRESRYDGNDRSGVLGRSGTVLSRANTQGRNGTLSRAANGGTVGSRRGAFGRGAGASIGTQPEEVLGRDDIHTRAELSERILDDATLRRLSTMEKKDAARLAKIIKSEGKAEHAAVKGSIKELERLNKLQREAAHAERKSQSRLSKWISKEHRARLRFLKEKERYEKVEGDLRNAENDYEERRDHAAGLTAQVAEKTQELDDLRGQKAADDREREVKLLALKNPAHS